MSLAAPDLTAVARASVASSADLNDCCACAADIARMPIAAAAIAIETAAIWQDRTKGCHDHIPARAGMLRARGEPVLVGAEFESELVVVDSEIAVPASRDRIGPQRRDLLGDDADIGLVAAEIAESVVAQTIVEMSEQNHVVLQRQIRAPSTAAAAKAATATAAEAAAARRRAPPPPPCAAATTTAAFRHSQSWPCRARTEDWRPCRTASAAHCHGRFGRAPPPPPPRFLRPRLLRTAFGCRRDRPLPADRHPHGRGRSHDRLSRDHHGRDRPAPARSPPPRSPALARSVPGLSTCWPPRPR